MKELQIRLQEEMANAKELEETAMDREEFQASLLEIKRIEDKLKEITKG